MTTGLSLWFFAVSLVASALGGMLGMAGGIFIVPVLTTFGGIGVHEAIGASIVSVIACSCSSAAPLLKRGLTNVRLAIVLETATTLGALTGIVLNGVLPVSFLFLFFALVLLLSAYQMLARRTATAPVTATNGEKWASSLRLDSSYRDDVTGERVPYEVKRLPVGMSLMYGAGLVSALLGIGSGVLKIPAMDTALRLPIKVSSATSNFMIGVTAAASAGAYFVRGDIVPAIAGPVALGSVVGALVGARGLLLLSNERLRTLFVTVLILLASQMLLRAFGIHVFQRSE